MKPHIHRLRARTAIAMALGTALLAAPVRAQDDVDPVDPIEDRALAEEAQAAFEQALQSYKQAFDKALDQASSGGTVRRANLSRAEVLLEKIDGLSESVTRQAETEKYLAGKDVGTLGPLLKGQVDWMRAKYRLAEGDVGGAMGLATDLGFVRDWWIVGPFDNERGRGFNVESGPEKELDLGAQYDGKERKVAWRKVPAQAPLGYVDLDVMLRPNDQAKAYAVAFVKSDAAREAALRLGSDEAVKVWWNGEEVLARDVRRPIEFDQDVVGVNVAEGWNVLLMKVCDQTGAWGFRARLTTPAGGHLDGIMAATTAEEAAEAIAAAPQTAPFAGEVDGGAKAFYEEVTAAGANARDLFHLGFLHHRREFDTVSDRKAENLLKQAAELEPTNAIFRFHYAEAAAPPTEMAVEKEENRQRQGREKALELEPGYAIAYRALAEYYTSSLVNLDRAEQLLRQALEINPDYFEARLDLSNVLARRGLPAAAEKERTRALADASAKGLESRGVVYARELEREGRGPEAIGAWREVLSLDGRENGVRRRVAELALRAMLRDDALAMLREIHSYDPFDTEASIRLAQLHEGAGEWDEALAALGDALAITPEEDAYIAAVGRVQMKAGRTEEALAAFREALAINPKRQDLERYVEFLDPSAAPFEDAFAQSIEPLIERARDYDNAENDGWLVLLDQTVDKVNNDGTSSQYVHQSMKILTEAGVKAFDRFFVRARGGQSFKWKWARVIKPDGSVVDAKTESQRGFRWADFPPLVPGDVIEAAYRTDDREQSFFGDYFGTVNYFADQVPVLESQYTLITPAEREFYVHQRNLDVTPSESMSEDGSSRIRTWTVENADKVRSEPGMPGPREFAPQVQVTTYESWDAFAKWWWSMIRDQHIVSDEMKAKVAELVDGKETREEKIRAIYEFVTGEVTYQAWEFGVHGYKPYTTTSIFEKREGDCKDKAILLNTLLEEIGVEAYPVLIMAEQSRSEQDMTLAMVNHFNHCISYVPDVDGKGTARFLDGTAQYASMDIPPAMDRGATVLVVNEGGAELMKIPAGTPESMGLDQAWDVTVNADGSAVVEGEFTWRGDLAIQARQMFSVEGQRPLILNGLLAQAFGRVKLLENDFDDLKEMANARESFRVKAEVPAFAKAQGDTRTLPTGFLQVFGQLAQMADRPEREHDLILPNPMSFKLSATYHLPEGWTVSAAPESSDLSMDEAAFRSTATVNGQTLQLERVMEIKGDRVTTDVYAAFRENLAKATALSQQNWTVKPTQAPDEAAPDEQSSTDETK